jgi:acetyl-CoA synthetase (ADP-forming)
MPDRIISQAVQEGRSILNEYESKRILAAFGIPVTRERLITARKELPGAVREIGFPAAMKACSAAVAHKTEKNLIRLNIASIAAANRAYSEIRAAMSGAPGGILVQEMIAGQRELVAGMTRDEQFGPCVMFGLGGIFTEILHDVAFRRAPLTREEALAMMAEIRGAKILEAVRGMETANRERLADILMAVGRIALDHERIREIDINPLIIRKGEPVAVDALIVLNK